jgi:YVTN family beta-propeller protein
VSNYTVINDLGGLTYNDVAVTPDGSKLYLTHFHCSATCPLSVIDTSTNTLIAEIYGGPYQFSSAVAVAPDGSKVYAATFPYSENSPEAVLVIDTATNMVIGTIPLPTGTGFAYDAGLSVTPDGSKIYVANIDTGTVSVIQTATSAVIATIPVAGIGVAIIPDIPYSSMNAALAIERGKSPGHDSFELESSFTLGSGSSGINPAREFVTLQICDVAATIPSGSFRGIGSVLFTFSGTIDGLGPVVS